MNSTTTTSSLRFSNSNQVKSINFNSNSKSLVSVTIYNLSGAALQVAVPVPSVSAVQDETLSLSDERGDQKSKAWTRRNGDGESDGEMQHDEMKRDKGSDSCCDTD